MADRELKRMSRGELVEIISELTYKNQELEERCRALEQKLEAQEMTIAQAGSIAEATVGLSGIFRQAQETADAYLERIHRMHADTEEEASQLLAQARSEAEETRRQAEQEIAEKWAELEQRSKKVLDSHAELRALVKDLYGGRQYAAEE